MAGPPPASVETTLTRGMFPGHGVGITDDDTDGLAEFDGEALLLRENEPLAEDDRDTERPEVGDSDGLTTREDDAELDDDATGLEDRDGETDNDATRLADRDGDTDVDARDLDRVGDTDLDARDADRDRLAVREGDDARLAVRDAVRDRLAVREGDDARLAVREGDDARDLDRDGDRDDDARDNDRDGLAARVGETLGDRRVRVAELEAETLAEDAGDGADGDGDGDAAALDVGMRRVATLMLEIVAAATPASLASQE